MSFRNNPIHPFRKSIALIICILLAASLVLPVAVYAQETKKTVRVGWYESPFNITDQHGRRSGYAY